MADEFASATRPLTTPPAIHPRTVDVGRGVAWLGEGWRLFIPAVGPWILIVIVAIVLNIVLVVIPVLGSISSHLLFPILMGGLMGLLIVFTITYAGGRLGVAATVGILIAGQLLMGVAIDRFGLFGSTKIPLHWPRVLGIVLLGAGAALSLKK